MRNLFRLICELTVKTYNIIKSYGLKHFAYRALKFIKIKGWRSFASPTDLNSQYKKWLTQNKKTVVVNQGGFSFNVAIIILGRSDPPSLIETFKSVFTQQTPKWELFLDKALFAHLKPVVSGEMLNDDRVKFLDVDVDPAKVLENIKQDYIWFVKSGDILRDCAVWAVQEIIGLDGEPDLIYVDDDRYDCGSGRRFAPRFKPGWSPHLLYSFNYIGFSAVFKKQTIKKVQNQASPIVTGDTYSLLTQLTNFDIEVKHISDVLYSSRSVSDIQMSSKETTKKELADCAVLEKFFSDKGYSAVVSIESGIYNYRIAVKSREKVSIIIPTKNNVSILRRCINSILMKSSYDNFEIIIIDNGSTDNSTLEYFDELNVLDNVRVISYPHDFNYAIVNNMGAEAASGAYLLFLNDDTEVISSDWIEAMMELCQMQGVGAVGAYLLFPNGLIQHAGIVIGMRGSASHAFYKSNPSGPLYMNLNRCVRNVSAVTAACLMVRTQYFNKVGGFDPRFRIGMNDVDLCLRLMNIGLVNLVTPHARLFHHESLTRGSYVDISELDLFNEIYSELISQGDPYYHPALSLSKNDFSLVV